LGDVIELRYGSREFLAASDMARSLPYSPPVFTLARSVLRDPALLRSFVAIWRLPVIELRVRRADVDAWSDSHFGPARRGRRAQAVLELPAAEQAYLSGRHKQALRTNLRHARDNEVTSDRALSYEEWSEAASVILNARHDDQAAGAEMARPEPGQHVAYYVARDRDKAPLAFAGIALFGQFAMLFSLLSHPRPASGLVLGAVPAAYLPRPRPRLLRGQVPARRLGPAGAGRQSVLPAPAGLPGPQPARRNHPGRRLIAARVTMMLEAPCGAGAEEQIMDGTTVPVADVASRAEADLIVGLLQSNGVTASVSADDAGGTEPQLQLQGVRVLVAPSDEAAARRLLAGIEDNPA
jgi:hypothetical protein